MGVVYTSCVGLTHMIPCAGSGINTTHNTGHIYTAHYTGTISVLAIITICRAQYTVDTIQ